MLTVQAGVLGQCVLNTDRQIQTVDEAFSALLGRTVYEMNGKLEADFTHHDDRKLTSDLLNKLEFENEPFAITKRYVRADDTVIWVTNHVSMHGDSTALRHFSITSSRCNPTPTDSIVANWQIANHVQSAFTAGKAIFGSDLFCATPVEALLLLYMAESDGRSLSLEDVSTQAQITIPAMARWITVLAERDLVEIAQHSSIPASTVLRISQACFGTLDELIRKSSS